MRTEMEARGQIDHVATRTDTKGREQPARRGGARHKCWECGVRAVVGEVQEHSFPQYEDIEVWLHNSCVAAFEQRLGVPSTGNSVDPETSAEARKAEAAQEDAEIEGICAACHEPSTDAFPGKWESPAGRRVFLHDKCPPPKSAVTIIDGSSTTSPVVGIRGMSEDTAKFTADALLGLDGQAARVIDEINTILKVAELRPQTMKDAARFGEQLQVKGAAFIELAQRGRR